jgi:hypothetical protein
MSANLCFGALGSSVNPEKARKGRKEGLKEKEGRKHRRKEKGERRKKG